MLGRLVPGLERLPVHRRPDGKDVRYLAPHPGVAESRAHDAAQIGAIVFPRYSPSADCEARRLSPLEAFEALLPEFYPLANRFDGDTLDRLTRLLTQVACIRLTYGDLRAGMNAVQELAC